jgi:hypothetical protein
MREVAHLGPSFVRLRYVFCYEHSFFAEGDVVFYACEMHAKLIYAMDETGGVNARKQLPLFQLIPYLQVLGVLDLISPCRKNPMSGNKRERRALGPVETSHVDQRTRSRI